MTKGNFMLHWWGGSEPFIRKELGNIDEYLWFDTPQERQTFKEKLSVYKSLGLMIVEQDGSETHYRTIANLVFQYKGKEYSFQHDFGYGYAEESAEYMWTEGNYSCDCNRSIFLMKKYPEDFKELECGCEIVLLGMTIFFQKDE